MLATRGVWIKAIATLTIPFLALAALLALGAGDRIDKAQAASDDLDGIFPFATVASIEASLHEEGALAIALAAELIEQDEFTTATAATDEARVELVDELTYHEPDSPIGSTLGEIETGMATIEEVRSRLLAGTFDGTASEPYRELLGSTKAATLATMPVLVSPSTGAAPLADLDAARSASGEAVFEATATIFEASGTEPVTDALARLAAADLMLQQTAAPDVVTSIQEALSSPEATVGAEGTAAIANGELPDLFAWADATVPWVLAYGDPEIAAIEASTGTMGLRAERAEDAALEYIIVSVSTWIGLFIVSLLVTRSILNAQVVADERRPETEAETTEKDAPSVTG